MATEGGFPNRACVGDLPAFDRFPCGEAGEDHLGPCGSFTGGRVGTAEGKADGNHVPFPDHRLDRHSDVGELFVQACEGPLHAFATATDARRFGVKLVLIREELVGRIQVLLVDHMLHDSAHGGLVLIASVGHARSLCSSSGGVGLPLPSATVVPIRAAHIGVCGVVSVRWSGSDRPVRWVVQYRWLFSLPWRAARPQCPRCAGRSGERRRHARRPKLERTRLLQSVEIRCGPEACDATDPTTPTVRRHPPATACPRPKCRKSERGEGAWPP